MNKKQFIALIQTIVSQAQNLKDKHTDQKRAPVNYACIFCQSEEEFTEFKKKAQELGKVIKQTSTGPLFYLNPPIQTIAGPLRLLKIRQPDTTRPERGDADFTVDNRQRFKEKYLNQPGFKLITRPEFEMIELMDSKFNVRAYFSHPTLEELLNLSN